MYQFFPVLIIMIDNVLFKLKLKEMTQSDFMICEIALELATNATSSFAVDCGEQLDQLISKCFFYIKVP